MAVLSLARPHILAFTAKITARAVAIERGVKARFARKRTEDSHASGA
jgi:hypothetical protein